MDLRDFDIERLEFTEAVIECFERNGELREGMAQLLQFIRLKQTMQDLDAQIPVTLATKNGSWIKAELVGIDRDEVMTTEGKGSFMVHKIHHLNGIYPPLLAM